MEQLPVALFGAQFDQPHALGLRPAAQERHHRIAVAIGHRHAHGAEQHFLEAGVAVQDYVHRTMRRQLLRRQIALRGGNAHVFHQQFEQALVAQRRAQQRFVVAEQDAAPCLRLLTRDLGQTLHQGFGECVLHRAVHRIALQIFAAGSGRQAVGFDHPTDETGPWRQQFARVVMEQHATQKTDRLRLSLVP